MRLATYLKEVGMEPIHFAVKLGVSQNTIYRYLRGAMPTVRNLSKIIRATDGKVTMDDFIHDSQSATILKK
jgi:predicted transcriptional regulator